MVKKEAEVTYRSITPRVVSTETQTHEAGQVAVWLVILLPVLLALVGLVFDGGLLYAQYRRGRWAADGAAVAAANSIDPARYADTGQVELDSGLAYSTARKYALDNDPGLSLRSVTIADNVVQVRGTLTIRPSFLSLFGVGPVTLDISGQERPAWGITRTGQ
jgi:Flp pilus assembly protein TadG